ncbi:MAG TPA: DUF1501 domain-containing protein, partial [Gemmataceae bacterium]|nr:DUF1501 domain-containing protein [Gemmataceae bacterium]
MKNELLQRLTRRTFLGNSASIGAVALAALLKPELLRGAGPGDDTRRRLPGWTGIVRPLHHAPRARRVIILTMAGGPSHLETLDYKPRLAQMHGQPMPESFTRGQPIAQLQGQRLMCFGPQHPFRKFGRSGQEIAGIFPHIGSIADDICIIRSMRTEAINHDPA